MRLVMVAAGFPAGDPVIHPLSFVRKQLASHSISHAGELADEARWPHGRKIPVAGLALVRQRPGTASGILFMTIEDEMGVANLVVRPAFMNATAAPSGRVSRSSPGEKLNARAKSFIYWSTAR